MSDNAQLAPQPPLTPEQMQEFFTRMLQTSEAERLAHAKENGFSKSDFQQERIKEEVFSKYDFVRVRNVGQYGTIYYAPKEGGSAHMLKDVDVLGLVRDEYMRLYNMAPASKMQASIDTLKIGVTD